MKFLSPETAFRQVPEGKLAVSSAVQQQPSAAHGCSEARPCFLHHGLNLSLEVGYSLGAQSHPGVVATPDICYA